MCSQYRTLPREPSRRPVTGLAVCLPKRNRTETLKPGINAPYSLAGRRYWKFGKSDPKLMWLAAKALNAYENKVATALSEIRDSANHVVLDNSRWHHRPPLSGSLELGPRHRPKLDRLTLAGSSECQ